MGFGFDDGGGIGFFKIGGSVGCVEVDVEVDEDDMFAFRVANFTKWVMQEYKIYEQERLYYEL